MTHKNEILPAVAAAIFNEKGEILLQKRRDVNKWCIISGHVEFGETVEHALLREITEETNAGAAIVRFIGLYSSPDSQVYHYPGRSVQYITSYFEARLTEPIADDFSNEETGELRFFPTTHIPDNMATINPYWLGDALTRQAIPFVR